MMHGPLTDQPNANAYIEYILVYSSIWEEHLGHVRDVLESLRKVSLTAKCVWGGKDSRVDRT